MDFKGLIDTRRRGNPDLVLFMTVFLLIGTGLAMSYSASAVLALKDFGDSFYYLKRQLIWFGCGLVLLLIFQEIDYRLYAKHTKLILAVSLICLLAVFLPGIGHAAKGSTRWIGAGSLRFQPSEFVKVGMVIYLARVFSADSEERGADLVRLLVPFVILGVFFILILMQPDFSTAVILLLVAVTVFFASGFSAFYLLTLFLLSIPAVYLLVYQVDYRRERILGYLDPWKDRFGLGYHIIQSFVSFKKGGLLGVGLGYGTQKLGRLPEPHTDFIFSVIAEEAGLFGTLAVLAMYGVFFWRGVRIAVGASEGFGHLLATGLTMLICFQGLINIGVVTGSLPTTGVTLPFISYGGSSLMSSMIAAGILLNISRFRDVVPESYKFQNDNEVWQ